MALRGRPAAAAEPAALRGGHHVTSTSIRASPSRGSTGRRHVTTTDMSLELLLGPQLEAFADRGYEVVGAVGAGPVRRRARARVGSGTSRSRTRPGAWRPSRTRARWSSSSAVPRAAAGDRAHAQPEAGALRPGRGPRGAGAGRRQHRARAVRTARGPRWPSERSCTGSNGSPRPARDAELLQNAEDLPTLRRLGVPEARLDDPRQRHRPRPLRPGRGSTAERRRRRARELGAPRVPTTSSSARSGGSCARRAIRSCSSRGRRSAREHPHVRVAVDRARTTTTRPTGSTPRDRARAAAPACASSAHRADVDRLYAGWTCSCSRRTAKASRVRRWRRRRWACRSSRPTSAAAARSSTTASPACSCRRAIATRWRRAIAQLADRRRPAGRDGRGCARPRRRRVRPAALRRHHGLDVRAVARTARRRRAHDRA